MNTAQGHATITGNEVTIGTGNTASDMTAMTLTSTGSDATSDVIVAGAPTVDNDVTITAGADVTVSRLITSNAGDISITATNDVTVNVGGAAYTATAGSVVSLRHYRRP